MEIRRAVVAGLFAAGALALTGCGESGPEISVDQVAIWQQTAVERVPSARSISVEKQSTGTDMFGNASTYVAIDAEFASIADLVAGEKALAQLANLVVQAVGGDHVELKARYENAHSDAASVSEAVPPALSNLGVVKWYVADQPYEYDADNRTVHSDWFVRIYADSPDRVTPEWLADVADAASKHLSQYQATIGFLDILPGSAADAVLSSDEFRASIIDVRDLKSFKKYGIKHNCVRTDRWAFDVEYGYIRAYPAGSPKGSCA